MHGQLWCRSSSADAVVSAHSELSEITADLLHSACMTGHQHKSLTNTTNYPQGRTHQLGAQAAGSLPVFVSVVQPRWLEFICQRGWFQTIEKTFLTDQILFQARGTRSWLWAPSSDWNKNSNKSFTLMNSQKRKELKVGKLVSAN